MLVFLIMLVMPSNPSEVLTPLITPPLSPHAPSSAFLHYQNSTRSGRPRILGRYSSDELANSIQSPETSKPKTKRSTDSSSTSLRSTPLFPGSVSQTQGRPRLQPSGTEPQLDIDRNEAAQSLLEQVAVLRNTSRSIQSRIQRLERRKGDVDDRVDALIAQIVGLCHNKS